VNIIHYSVVDSTMTVAAVHPIGTVVTADEQTAGQGRHGHSWHSEPGAGLYCSIVLEATPLLTLALGLATVDAITQVTGLACDLRWPNDVMIGSKKVAGILVQLADGKAIAGIGINVGHARFPDVLAREATSLLLEGAAISRDELLTALLRSVEICIQEHPTTILRLFTHASSYAVGRRVIVHQAGGTIEGITAGLDESGFLKVRKNDGTDTLIVAGGVRAAGS
jgi:BirA family biotin operon repressor/biotin-[acetyl-CoA-carboxylase] ligase